MRLSLVMFALLAACNGRTIPPSSVSPSIQASCRFDAPVDPSAAVLAAALDGNVYFVHADGSNTVAYTFGGAPNATPPASWYYTLSSSGRFVAAAATSSTLDSSAWRQEVVLLDAGGKLVSKQAWDSAPAVIPYLNAEGALAYDLGGADTLLVDAQGQTRTLTGITPLAEPDAAGNLPAHGPLVSGATTYGWVRAGESTLSPLRYPVTGDSLEVQMVAGRMVYLGRANGAMALVNEGPNDARVIALPEETGVEVYITQTVPTGWVLLGNFEQAMFRVNLSSEEVVQVGMVNTPSGLRRFQAGVFGPQLDAGGALLTALRDDYSGALYRSTDGVTWSRLGETVTNVLDIEGIEGNGTYLIAGTNARYASEQWTAPTPGNQPDLDGQSLQVVRPGDSLSRVAAGAATWNDLQLSEISNDGLCVAYWQTQDDQTVRLKALDVERGKLVDLLPNVEMQPSTSMAWISSQ